MENRNEGKKEVSKNHGLRREGEEKKIVEGGGKKIMEERKEARERERG